MRLYALFRLAFATAPPVTSLTLLQRVTRRLILQKARRHPFQPCKQGGIGLRLVVGTRFQILFHSAHSGSFHLSLTVLVHYRSLRVFSLGRWASRIPTELACSVVLRNTGWSLFVFAYGTVTLYGLPFQYSSANKQFCNSTPGPTTPLHKSTAVWAIPRSLATTNRMISFPRVTKMFQFTRFPSLPYVFR